MWSIIGALPLIGMLILWGNAFQNREVIGDFNKFSIFSYYIFGYLISSSVSSHFEESFVDKIRQGDASNWFLKPISLKRFLYVHEISWRTMTIITVVIPILTITTILLPQAIPSINLATAL
ncbi:MAG: hypothetical protein CUN55_19805, partial [Phototrophicales bacterium]